VHGLVHAHVLEHIPGDINRIVRDMNKAIIPGGFHTFCVPFFSAWYREDMDPNMSHADRDRSFGQYDHVRSFGTKDFEERMMPLFEDFDRIDLTARYSPARLAQEAIPANVNTHLTSHTVFHFVKKSAAPAKTKETPKATSPASAFRRLGGAGQ
jgi:hypothetical protein